MSQRQIVSRVFSEELRGQIEALGEIYLEPMKQIANGAGRRLLETWSAPLSERAYQGKDIKLDADVESERFIISELQKVSEFPILGEEAGWVDGRVPSDQEPCWVIDPLDGTFNYSRRIPMCSVSIGLFVGDYPVLGAINNFAMGELFYGSALGPVFRNDKKSTVSMIKDLTKSCLATGFPVLMSYSEESLKSYIASVQKFKKVRCYGGACYAITQVVSGSVEVYKEDGVRLWDVGAGLALIAGAGGSWTLEHIDKERSILNVIAGNCPDSIGLSSN